MDWASQLFNRPIDELLAMAAALDPISTVPVFLPHLDGERAPLWDAQSRGVFGGVSAQMGPAHFTLAVLEGVAYSVRWLLDSLQLSAACKPKLIAHAGGGARSDVWCQIRADVLAIPVSRIHNLDAGVAGSAMLAGVGEGLFPTISKAAKTFVKMDRLFEPRQNLAARHDAGFAKYQLLYQQLKPLNV